MTTTNQGGLTMARISFALSGRDGAAEKGPHIATAITKRSGMPHSCFGTYATI